MSSLVELRPVAGLQLYVEAPVAVSVAVCPAQMVAELTLIAKVELITTLETEVAVQLPFVPVIV